MTKTASEDKVFKIYSQIEKAGILPFLMTIVACIIIRSFIFESLWLDETISSWIVSDGILDVFYRATFFQGQSPFYYSWLWLVTSIIGSSDLALRILSIFCTSVTSVVLFRIARKYFDKETSFFAVLCFLSIDEVLVSAGSARPYAMALMFSTLSFLALINWKETGRFGCCLLYIVSIVFAVYSHYLFIPVLLVHSFYVLYQRDSRTTQFFRDYIITLVLILFLVIPGVFQCIMLFSRKDLIGFASDPTFLGLFKSIVPFYIFLYFVFGYAFCKIVLPKFKIDASEQRNTILTFLLVWYLAGPLILFTYSAISGTALFVSRYFLWSAPALGLIGAWIVDRMASGRAIFIVIFSVLVLVRESSRTWFIEDWAAVPNLINSYSESSGNVTFLYSGMAESTQTSWLNDSEKSTYLKSPLLHYKPQGVVLPIPGDFQDLPQQKYFMSTVRPLLKRNTGLFLVCLNQQVSKKTTGNTAQKNMAPKSSLQTCSELSEFFSHYGFKIVGLQSQGLVKVFALNQKL